jgi:hypothetical protein
MNLPSLRICFSCGTTNGLRKVKMLIAHDQLEEALTEMLHLCGCKRFSDFENEVIGFQRRLISLNRENRSGCLTFQEVEIMKNKLVKDVLSCLDSVENRCSNLQP